MAGPASKYNEVQPRPQGFSLTKKWEGRPYHFFRESPGDEVD